MGSRSGGTMFDPFANNFFGRTPRSLTDEEIRRSSDGMADMSPFRDEVQVKREIEQRSSFRSDSSLPPQLFTSTQIDG